MPHVWTARDRQHTLKGETTLVLARTKPVPEGNPAWEQESNEEYWGDERAKGFSSFISGFHISLGYSCHPLCAVARKMPRFCPLAHRSLTAKTKDDIRMLMNAQASKIVSLPKEHSSSSIRKPTVAVMKCTPCIPPTSSLPPFPNWGGQVLDKYLCHSMRLITSRCSSRNPGAAGEVQCKLIPSERRQTRHEEL